ncbi:MAG: hypothetical protein IKN78_10410 [Bacteroidales bacterium]|nr:hypothetical protein [Bacteroidales bacterium]
MKKTLLLTFVGFMVLSGLKAQNATAWNLTGNAFPWISAETYFLGSTNNYPLLIRTNNQDRMYISTAGNVGIGTNIPQQMLHIVGGNILISRTSSNRAPGSANGSLLFGDTTTTLNPFGEWGIEYVNAANEIPGLNFWKPFTTSHVSMNYCLFLKDDGNVGIGTNNPQAKLAVNGEILTKSVRVNTNATYWPDYVFEDSYNLMSLRELERYVNAHKHLPGVPSAQEVEAKGDVDLGAMNALLLEKVEELTRYVIDLQNQIDELKNGKE